MDLPSPAPARRSSSLRLQHSMRGGTMATHAARSVSSSSLALGRASTPEQTEFAVAAAPAAAAFAAPAAFADRPAPPARARSSKLNRVDSGEDADSDDDADDAADLVRWWKSRPTCLRSVSVTAFLHELTIFGDYVFET